MDGKRRSDDFRIARNSTKRRRAVLGASRLFLQLRCVGQGLARSATLDHRELERHCPHCISEASVPSRAIRRPEPSSRPECRNQLRAARRSTKADNLVAQGQHAHRTRQRPKYHLELRGQFNYQSGETARLR